ncbi:AMP phosphorylase, partial [archaeon]
MIAKVKFLNIDAGGKPIVVMNADDSKELGIKSSERIWMRYGKKQTIAIANIATKSARGYVGVYDEVKNVLGLKEGVEIEIDLAKYPESLEHIKNKLKGRKLEREDIFEIVRDVIQSRLSEAEIAAFVTNLHDKGMDMGEAADLSVAMVETGQKLNFNGKIICDKHSVGGVPGDKTTLLVVPIIAAAGLTIPKTSSRAITSAAGTADRAEVLMPVDLEIEEIKDVVNKVGGCIVWGGALHLAPADDIFIQVEYPLSIDPMLLPSIMSKKKAVGATHLVIDIPTGRGTKIKTIGDADLLAKDFIGLGKKLGIETQCAVTYGEQPIGYSVGSALEAKEAFEILTRAKRTPDVIDKAVNIAGMLLEMAGKQNGKELALDILKSGKAEAKMRQIMEEQGGEIGLKPEDILIGEHGVDVYADRNGMVMWIDNGTLVDAARKAGSPNDKGAGIALNKKLGDSVRKGERLFTVYAEKAPKLERTKKIIDENVIMGVGDKMEMLVHTVKGQFAAKKG